MDERGENLGPDRRFLTTREVAELLRVKERKVYDLAAEGEIPHRRVTGKLLFPQAELMAWLDGPGSERPAVLAGSHDPLLDWAVRESGCGLATLYDGSTDGLERFARSEAALAGMHFPEADGWNTATVAAHDLRQAVLVGWVARAQGLILRSDLGEEITCIADLRGRTVALRQDGAGSRALFERLTAGAGLTVGEFAGSAAPARTETEAAAAVATGEADATLGLAAMARQFRLPFVPLVSERFDLLIDWRAHFTAPVQTLLSFARTETFRRKAESLGGYDLSGLGEVRWLSP